MMLEREINPISEEDGYPPANQNGKRTVKTHQTESPKKYKSFGLYRQPTPQELNRLQETETLFNSNLFRLQVDEILQEVKVKDKTAKKFSDWFTLFKAHLLNIPEDDNEYDLSEKTLLKRLRVKLPLSSELKKTKCIFKFHKFKEVEIVGSYALGCSINSQLKVDLQITVPADTYTKNDSINYRYHKKRAAYLANIAAHVVKCEIVQEVKYSWLNGSETAPVLDVRPVGKLGNQLLVRINLTCHPDAYKLHRLSPTRNNLRESWILPTETENDAEIGPQTPHYNSSILADLTASANQEILKKVLLKSENLKQAIVLLKIWLRQRRLRVSGHVVCLLVAYFVQEERINNIMSSYQIVRNIWIALSVSDLDARGITLHKGPGTPSTEEFRRKFGVVFLDITGYYNVCWEMCKGTYDALKRESALAVKMLDNGKINSFTPLFMTPLKSLLQFDHILRFKNLQLVKESVLKRTPNRLKVNFGVDRLGLVTDRIHALVSNGLFERVDVVLDMVEADLSWHVNTTPERAKAEGYEEKLSFGLIYNTDNAMNIIEKGPEANLSEAQHFRNFWGHKSELRRFEDGSILETCVWRGDAAAERRTIPKQIIDHLFEARFGVAPSELFHVHDQLSSLTASKQYFRNSALHVEESSAHVLRAFHALRRDLRHLPKLALDITAVYGVSPVFSYSDPLPPTPCADPPRPPRRRGDTCIIKDIKRADVADSIPEYTPVTEAVIELIQSGKWPGDIEGFRCLKAALHLQIAKQLTQEFSLPTQAYPTHLDVLKQGLVFRLSIAHPKEITLVKRRIENGVVKSKNTEESIQMQCKNMLLPRLRGALHGLHSKHTAFGPTVCLFKRWLSAHLLSPPHFPDTVAELVVARVFLTPAPLGPPATPTVGLMRTLATLVDTDWATEVVVLDFNNVLSRNEVSTIERGMSVGADRPPMCVVTALDGPLPSVWSQGAPSLAVLTRAGALAASTLKYLQRELLVNTNDNVLGAFVPSLAGYSALLHVRAGLAPRAAERVGRRPAPRAEPAAAADLLPVVEFNPVLEYLEELRSAYSEFALFLHDLYGGDTIAVLWKPDIGKYRDFQLLGATALTPVTVNGETKYKVNIAALLEDFRILGAGLISHITVQ